MPSKKYLILLILKILENESDESHPLTQSQIARLLSEVFPCDRKTVCRNIAFLKKIGYPIWEITQSKFNKKWFCENQQKYPNLRKKMQNRKRNNIEVTKSMQGKEHLPPFNLRNLDCHAKD